MSPIRDPWDPSEILLRRPDSASQDLFDAHEGCYKDQAGQVKPGKIWKDLVPAHGKTQSKRVLKTIAKISICPDLLSICSATGWPSNTRLLQFPMDPWHPSPYLFKICLTKWIKWTTVQSSGCKSYEQKHYTIFTWKGHTFCVTYSASCWIFGVLYIITCR